MPLVTAQNRVPVLIAPEVGLQDVAGELVIGKPTLVRLDATLFGKSGTYGKYNVFKLFKFGTLRAENPGDTAVDNLQLSPGVASLGRSTAKFTVEGNYIVLTFT